MRGLVPLFVGLSGCAFVAGGDVDRAAHDGALFLQEAFVEHRFADAAKVSPNLDAGRLRAIVDGVEHDIGPVIATQPMSSAPASEHGRIYVWYRVQAARASGNVGLLVSGDGRRGYQVEKLHVDAKAPPARWPGHPFRTAVM
jgi:hypothetical protein